MKMRDRKWWKERIEEGRKTEENKAGVGREKSVSDEHDTDKRREGEESEGKKIKQNKYMRLDRRKRKSHAVSFSRKEEVRKGREVSEDERKGREGKRVK